MKDRKVSVQTPLRVAIYARTSTSDGSQDLGLQIDELREEVKRRGWKLAAEFTAQASGAKDDRPGLLAALAAAKAGDFGALFVWKLDRLARSLRRLLEVVDALEESVVGLVSLRDPGIDTTTPSGRLILQVFGAVAEFERALITERVRAGVARVKATGRTKSGKPTGRPRRLSPEQVEKATLLRAEGRSWRKIAMAVGAPFGTIRDALAGGVRKDPLGNGPLSPLGGGSQEGGPKKTTLSNKDPRP